MKKRIIASKIISIVCWCLIALLVPILLLNLIIIIKGNVNKEELPFVLGYSTLAVETDSMKPVFSGGDLIVIKRAEIQELVKEDIISYYDSSANSTIITHRIIGIIENEDGTKSFRTQGDNNNIPDSSIISEGQIVGKYLFRIEKAGTMASYLSTTNGMFLFGILPLLFIFVVDYIMRVIEQKRTKKYCC